MKKLMIAAATIAIGMVASAANYNWSMDGSVWQSSCGGDYWETVTSGTSAYLVFADAYSQSALVEDFANGSANIAKLSAAGVGVINADGGINSTAATGDYTSNQQAYFVVFDAGNMFVSDQTTAPYDALTGGQVSFDDQDPFSDPENTPIRDAASGYAGAGWYTASVPEPTSGLLLLLGVAGLALRRKRA